MQQQSIPVHIINLFYYGFIVSRNATQLQETQWIFGEFSNLNKFQNKINCYATGLDVSGIIYFFKRQNNKNKIVRVGF